MNKEECSGWRWSAFVARMHLHEMKATDEKKEEINVLKSSGFL